MAGRYLTWGWTALFALRPRCESTVVVRSVDTPSPFTGEGWGEGGVKSVVKVIYKKT